MREDLPGEAIISEVSEEHIKEREQPMQTRGDKKAREIQGGKMSVCM